MPCYFLLNFVSQVGESMRVEELVLLFSFEFCPKDPRDVECRVADEYYPCYFLLNFVLRRYVLDPAADYELLAIFF